jgi:SAM-dependent methyltransferase
MRRLARVIELAERPLIRRVLDFSARWKPIRPTCLDFERELGPAQLAQDTQSATKLLYDRLTADDVDEVTCRAATTPELAHLPKIGNDPAARRWLVLNYGMWLKVPYVIERTGLRADQPPEDVHSMARGPLAAAGGLGEADMVVDAIRSSGAELIDAEHALDFGCSSGRVVRVLAAAFPEVRWRGCDPNEPAIEWAREHLGGIDFFVSPQQPPLPIAEGELGVVYAISIWSHFAPELGLRWFDEIHRLIRPGGRLVFTTHGMQSVSFYAEQGLRPPEQSRAIVEGLYRRGFWYAAEFGQTGDAGIVNPEWGTTFLSAEWLLTKLCPGWRVLEYAPGRNQLNQDVYVLERV